MLKRTSSEHPDFENLQKALDQIKEIADHINESKRISENQNKLKDIQVKYKFKYKYKYKYLSHLLHILKSVYFFFVNILFLFFPIQINSNQFKSIQFKSNQFNQFKSNQINSNQFKSIQINQTKKKKPKKKENKKKKLPKGAKCNEELFERVE